MSRFLANWRTFFLKATDASYEYCEAAGLMALSSMALGRRSLDVGRGLQPNLFMMLAGDSSIARKSTSVGLCKALIDRVDPIRVGPRDYTVEGLLKWMASEKDPATGKSRNKVVLFAEEFGSDLARIEAYGGTTTADFCALYDGGTFEKVRAKAAPLIVDKPRVNLFAAAAYQMLQTYLRTRDWLSGYMMRFIYVAPVSLRPRFTLPPSWPSNEFEAAVVSAKVLKDDLTKKYMKLGLDPVARRMFEQWSQSVEMYTQAMPDSVIMHTYTGRFLVNAQKLALLYQLDIDPFAPIGPAAAQLAIDFASNICWPSFAHVQSVTTLDDFTTTARTVMQFIKAFPGGVASKRTIESRFSGERIRKVLEHLVWSEQVLVRKTDRGEEYVLR